MENDLKICILELISNNVSGWIMPRVMGGYWFFTFINDYSSFVEMEIFTQKLEFLNSFRTLKLKLNSKWEKKWSA